MVAIGEGLRAAREDRGIELERAAEETRIARRFIVALEAEDFDAFPGEPYALGFLRNYAEYLGLDAEEYVQSFRNLRILEEPLPIKDLIPAKRSRLPLVIAIVAVVVVAGVGTTLALGLGKRQPAGETLAGPHTPVDYRVEGATSEHRLWRGDSVIVPIGRDSYKVTLADLGDGAIFTTPMGQRRLSLGEETVVDFDKDGQADFRMLLTDLDKRNPDKGASFRLSLLGAAARSAGVADPTTQAGASAAAGQGGATATEAAAPAAPQAAMATAPTPAPQSAPAVVAKEGIVFDGAKSPYPFVVTVTFRGPCMFRYEVDRKDRDERYYQKGETVTMNANNSAKLWASNAQSAAVTVQASGGKSADLSLGGPGEVAVKRLAWSQGDNGAYNLSLYEVD